MMKAIQVHQYGGVEVLQLEEIPAPAPQDHEVLIQVKAAALNPVDSKIRNGYLKEMVPTTFPFIPGWEAAGIVTATGKKVTEFKAGDEVFTRTPFQKGGGYAEYMTAGEAETVIKPASLSFADAAGLSIVGSAAYTTLFELAHLKEGQRLFILGAGGSVGLLAIQMARAAGAFVIGTATGADLENVLAAGADQAVDYKTPPFADNITDIDLALDLVGGPAQETLWKMLKREGLLLSTAMPPSPEKAKQYGVNASFVFTQPNKPVMQKLAAMAGNGLIRMTIGKTLPLADARQAQTLMDERKISGKIILEIK
jgi:NADPH:quinone reductase-like Zn-dependent oxidoreductase